MIHRPPHSIQNFVHLLQIEFFRMNFAASPSPEVIEFFVPWFEDDLQEFLVSMRPADILRWTAPFTGKADRLRSSL